MKIKSLVEYLETCDTAYYINGNSIVSNETYEGLVRSLRKMDPTNPYLLKVGSKIQGNSRKVSRLSPMGSLTKYTQEDTVRAWADGITELGKEKLMMAAKYDGFACELDYINGELVMASTRGNGVTGEDVTDAARYVVPLTVPKGLTKVRGEFIIPKSNHDVVKKLGYTAMRNAVPGIVRSNADAIQHVHFVAYEFFEEVPETDRLVLRHRYSDLFKIETYDIGDIDQLVEQREVWINSFREDYDYEVDGLVLKTLNMMQDEWERPLFQIAWKFKSNREATTLTKVRMQIGVTGKLVPIGEFEPVEFQGAKLRNASLGSIGRMKKMIQDDIPLKIGAIIEVSRRGDIIPYIEECTYSPDDAELIELPKECPYCSERLEYRGEEPYCINHSCPQLLELRLVHYIKSTGMKGIGSGLVSKLIGSGFKHLADIYKVDKDSIKVPGFGASAVAKWDELQNKELSKLQFVSALPFADIGPAVWKKLFEIMTLRKILDLTEEDLLSMDVKGFGPSKRSSFITQKDRLLPEIEDLLTYVRLN